MKTVTPVEHPNKFQHLTPRLHVIQGDPEELVALSWEEEVNILTITSGLAGHRGSPDGLNRI